MKEPLFSPTPKQLASFNMRSLIILMLTVGIEICYANLLCLLSISTCLVVHDIN